MNKLENDKITGGGLFGSKKNFNFVVKNTKKSESNFINAYEDMDKYAKKYNNAYIKHMDNLKIVDDYVNFNGMETLFTKVIMQDNFVKGHIDKTNPLLFRNYIIEGEVLPSTFRIEHLMNQIRYVMNKSIVGRDQSFIKYMSVTDISKNDFVLNTVTIDNIKQKKVIPHSDFLIDKEKTKKFIMDVVSVTMKKLKRSSLIAEYDEDEADYRKKVSKSRTKSKSGKSKKSNNSIVNMFKSGKSSKSKKKSESMIKISNMRHSKSQTKKSKTKSSIKQLRQEKLSEYLTPFEKHQRNERKKAENAEKMQKQAGIQKGFEEKKGMILGGPQTDIVPLQGAVPAGPEQPIKPYNPIEAKCKSHGQNKEACLADSPNCRFADKWNTCLWKDPNWKPPTFGNPPPTLGTNPVSNPFNIPQQAPQALI